MKYWLPVIFWALLIFAVSSIPSLKVTNDSSLQNLINNAGHFTEYTIFTFLLFRPLFYFHHLRHWQLYTSIFFTAFLYAFSDEFHQFFVPGRMTDPHDLFIDVLGILTMILYLHFRRYTSRYIKH